MADDGGIGALRDASRDAPALHSAPDPRAAGEGWGGTGFIGGSELGALNLSAAGVTPDGRLVRAIFTANSDGPPAQGAAGDALPLARRLRSGQDGKPDSSRNPALFQPGFFPGFQKDPRPRRQKAESRGFQPSSGARARAKRWSRNRAASSNRPGSSAPSTARTWASKSA